MSSPVQSDDDDDDKTNELTQNMRARSTRLQSPHIHTN